MLDVVHYKTLLDYKLQHMAPIELCKDVPKTMVTPKTKRIKKTKAAPKTKTTPKIKKT